MKHIKLFYTSIISAVLVLMILCGCTKTAEKTETSSGETEQSSALSVVSIESESQQIESKDSSMQSKAEESKPPEQSTESSSESSSESKEESSKNENSLTEDSGRTEEEIKQIQETVQRIADDNPEAIKYGFDIKYLEMAVEENYRPKYKDSYYRKMWFYKCEAELAKELELKLYTPPLVYQQALKAGDVKESDPKLTLEDLKEILDNVGDREDYYLKCYIYFEIAKKQKYPDYAYSGSGFSHREYWLDSNNQQDVREIIWLSYDTIDICYRIYNDEGKCIYEKSFYTRGRKAE